MSAALLDTTKYSKAFSTQLIELFRSKTCLWRNMDRPNPNRHERDLAWQAIVDKIREVDPTASRAYAIRKMNAFRSSWRRENKKVKRWRAVGEKYYPKLWYYDLFSFIEEEDEDGGGNGSPWELDQSADGGSEPGSSIHVEGGLNLNQRAGGSNQTEGGLNQAACSLKQPEVVLSQPIFGRGFKTEIIEQSYEMEEDDEEEADPFPFGQEDATRDAPSTPRSGSSADRAQQPQPPQADQDRRSTQPIAQQPVPIVEPPTHHQRLDLVGKNWAEKLKLLPDDQRVFAEKLINDVLFEAELGALGRHCYVSTQPTQPR